VDNFAFSWAVLWWRNSTTKTKGEAFPRALMVPMDDETCATVAC